MNYFAEVKGGSQTPPRIHPLLLSLTEAWRISNTSPDIDSVSENDQRVIRSPYYVSPSELPPLNAHFEKQAAGTLAAVFIYCWTADLIITTPRSSQQCRNSRSSKRDGHLEKQMCIV
jgi:hypothetical protein